MHQSILRVTRHTKDSTAFIAAQTFELQIFFLSDLFKRYIKTDFYLYLFRLENSLKVSDDTPYNKLELDFNFLFRFQVRSFKKIKTCNKTKSTKAKTK